MRVWAVLETFETVALFSTETLAEAFVAQREDRTRAMYEHYGWNFDGHRQAYGGVYSIEVMEVLRALPPEQDE